MGVDNFWTCRWILGRCSCAWVSDLLAFWCCSCHSNILCFLTERSNWFYAICYNNSSRSRSHTNTLWMQIDRMFIQDTHHFCCFLFRIYENFTPAIHAYRLITLQKQSTNKRIKFRNEISSFEMVIFGSLSKLLKGKNQNIKKVPQLDKRTSRQSISEFVLIFLGNISF